MGLDTNIAAVVAALDLKLVRLLRDAMNNRPGGAAPAGLVGPAATIEPRRVIEPEPRIEPRRVIHPTPRFEPRPVIRPGPRIDDPACVIVEVVVVDPPDNSKCPIEPPWRVLPWEVDGAGRGGGEFAQPAQRVKPRTRPPDIVSKGSLIDFFC